MWPKVEGGEEVERDRSGCGLRLREREKRLRGIDLSHQYFGFSGLKSG